MFIKVDRVLPFINKQMFPGGVVDLSRGEVGPPNDKLGKTKDAQGRKIKSNNIELGDILTFQYIGREVPDMSEANIIPEDEKMILNPMIVFAGFNQKTKNIVGVDIRRFRLAKQTFAIGKLIYALKDYYYDSQTDQNGNQILTRRTLQQVPPTLKTSFIYENFGNGLYSPIETLLKKYYRQYSPKRMRKSVIINIEIAEAISNEQVKALPGRIPE